MEWGASKRRRPRNAFGYAEPIRRKNKGLNKTEEQRTRQPQPCQAFPQPRHGIPHPTCRFLCLVATRKSFSRPLLWPCCGVSFSSGRACGRTSKSPNPSRWQDPRADGPKVRATGKKRVNTPQWPLNTLATWCRFSLADYLCLRRRRNGKPGSVDASWDMVVAADGDIIV